MSNPGSARLRWRADLREYGAAALRQAGLTNMAEEHEAEVLLLREHADMVDELLAAKQAYKSGSMSRADYEQVKNGMRAYMQAIRNNSGNRTATIDNFEEPSDAELAGLGY